MSDIDEVDFTESPQQDSSSFQFSTELPGTPPSIHKPFNSRPIQDNVERKHRRSVSEQIFTVPNLHSLSTKSYSRSRHRWRNLLDRNGEAEDDKEMDLASLRERYGGGSLCGHNSGWGFGNRSGTVAYYSDFSPFERSGETSNQPQSSAGYSYSGGHFKQALKRTVKKALNSPRMVRQLMTFIYVHEIQVSSEKCLIRLCVFYFPN